MNNAIKMALASSMEQIAGCSGVSKHVSGELGKVIKNSVSGAFIAAVMLTASQGAMAQNGINGGCVVGALAGGLLGHTAGGGHGKMALGTVGALLGCNAGQQIQNNSETQRQLPAGYPNQASPQPTYNKVYQGNDQAPTASVHPMGNYMPHTFAQINGQEQPRQALTTQGRMSMDKALSEAERRMGDNSEAQQGYAQAYQQLNQARVSGSNPEAQVLMGTQALQNNQYQYEGALNRAAQIRNQANMNFGSAGMRLSDLVEYEAFNGYDVRGYGDRIQRVLSAPMSAPVTGFDPTTKQNVTFSTGVSLSPATPPQPSYQQRRGY